MRMTITLVAKGDRPVDGVSAEFDEQGGTIGRRTDCTLVLADEQRHVSRVHALVEFRSDYFCIVDKGSYLPVQVNGMRVGRGQETPIFEGDEIHIGPYAMRVTHVAAAWDLDTGMAVSGLLARPAAEPRVEVGPAPEAPEPMVVSVADTSPDGNTPKKRSSRPRKRPRRKEPPLESIQDNPTHTHEPRQGMPLEESVARLLAADLGDPSRALLEEPDAVAAPGVEIAAVNDGSGDRPGMSTFDLLADRLQVKGDLAYEPFMPTVWDEIAKGPSAHPPAVAPADSPSPAPVTFEKIHADVDSRFPPAEVAPPAEPEEAVQGDYGSDDGTSGESFEAAPPVGESAAPPVEVAHEAPEHSHEAAVIARVVRRRRQRGKREEPAAEVADAHAELPMTESPDIVLVLQPVAAAETDATGRTDDYVIPIRRRNRRPQSAAR